MVRHLRAPSIRNVNSVSVAFQGTESEQESTGGSGDPMHSFVSHYENVGSTFRQQSWKKQKQKAIAVPTPRAGNVGSNSNTLGRGAAGAAGGAGTSGGSGGGGGGGGHHQHHQQQQQQQHHHHSNTLGATSLRHQQVRLAHQLVLFMSRNGGIL